MIDITEAQLSIIGNISSILGLLLSFGIAAYARLINNEVKKITRKVIFNTSSKRIIKDLAGLNADLLSMYDIDEKNFNNLKKEFVRISSLLDNVQSKLNDDLLKASKKTNKVVLKFRKRINELSTGKSKKFFFLNIQPFHRDEIFKIYENCSSLRNKIEIYIEETKRVNKYVK